MMVSLLRRLNPSKEETVSGRESLPLLIFSIFADSDRPLSVPSRKVKISLLFISIPPPGLAFRGREIVD